MAETYYERLGIAPSASVETIKRAYRRRLKDVHPDVCDDPDAADRTRRLIEAKRVLTDEHQRAVYDRIGHKKFTGSDATSTEREATTSERQGKQKSAASASTDKATNPRNGEADRERRRRQNRKTRAAWNPRNEVADGGRYAHKRQEGDSDNAYWVHPTDPSNLGSRLFPIGPSMVILFVAFGIYPILLWGTLEPAFPLVSNVIVGGCLLALVAYLASMPPIGVIIFGAWSVLLPALLLTASIVAPAIWIVAIVGTVVPLVLSTVVWAVLES